MKFGNAFLDLIEHFDGFLHIDMVTECCSRGVVDHHESGRCHQHLRACHSNDGSSRCRNAVNLDSDVSLVIHEHGIDLTCRYAVTAGRVDPDGNGAIAGEKFISEHLRCDIIVKPAVLGNRAVQFKNSLFGWTFVRLILPVPEFLHFWNRPPFRHRWNYQHRPHLRGSAAPYCRSQGRDHRRPPEQ